MTTRAPGTGLPVTADGLLEPSAVTAAPSAVPATLTYRLSFIGQFVGLAALVAGIAWVAVVPPDAALAPSVLAAAGGVIACVAVPTWNAASRRRVQRSLAASARLSEERVAEIVAWAWARYGVEFGADAVRTLAGEDGDPLVRIESRTIALGTPSADGAGSGLGLIVIPGRSELAHR